MLLTEYNEAEAMELFREEGRKEGREEGRKEGREAGLEEGALQTLASLALDGIIARDVAAERAGVSVEKLEEVIAELQG